MQEGEEHDGVSAPGRHPQPNDLIVLSLQLVSAGSGRIQAPGAADEGCLQP